MAFESILVGSGTIYIAAEGTAFPLPDASPSGSWAALGDIDGGVTMNVNRQVDLHRVDDESGPVKGTISEEDLQIVANLAEATLENMARALHGDTTLVTTASTPSRKILDMYRGVGEVPVRALLFRGGSPYGAFNAQFEVPRGIYTGNIGASFVKDNKTLIPVEFTALVDQSASPATQKFGRWVAQDA